MFRPISDIFVEVNGRSICVGKVVADYDDNTAWYNAPKYWLTNSEVEDMRRNFEIGNQEVGDLVYHVVAKFVDNVAKAPIKQKWIDELISMGYNVKEKLFYQIEE